MSIGSKLSVSPAESRVLSEQSEITLDSDSKLCNSVQSKQLQSPQNSISKASDTSSSATRNFGEIAKLKELDEQGTENENTAAAAPIVPKARPKTQDMFAEQDMFSEHFEVSRIIRYSLDEMNDLESIAIF